jgi:hypothetical protein
MSLATILRRGVGLQLEVMNEPSADALAETLVAFANATTQLCLTGGHKWIIVGTNGTNGNTHR